MFSILHYLSVLLLFTTIASALNLSRSYEHGPIRFDDTASLFFTINTTSRTAYLAVRIQDSDISLSGSNWVGLGVSEPNGGSMLGADIITAQFIQDYNDQCTFVDRHVPFAAYPLQERTPTSPAVFPEEDDCQNDGSWTLNACKRETSTGQIILEVSRSLDAHDTQDRDIPPDYNNIIYAFGTSFSYHSSRRASTRVLLYDDTNDQAPIGAAEQPLPDDVDGFVDIFATNYAIPSTKSTIYTCTSQVIPLKKGEKKMIVAVEPILNSTLFESVHHLTLYLCRGKEYAAETSSTIECSISDNGISGPLGNTKAGCTTFLAGCKFFLILFFPFFFYFRILSPTSFYSNFLASL